VRPNGGVAVNTACNLEGFSSNPQGFKAIRRYKKFLVTGGCAATNSGGVALFSYISFINIAKPFSDAALTGL